ncbi:hypothetical protein GGR50DRAFT_427158 [Xylaria sp. CBS 124048]|nr:hypothetical protein GGR50DRAFT_427158 [Xylaria sp. CBS 124048]
MPLSFCGMLCCVGIVINPSITLVVVVICAGTRGFHRLGCSSRVGGGGCSPSGLDGTMVPNIHMVAQNNALSHLGLAGYDLTVHTVHLSDVIIRRKGGQFYPTCPFTLTQHFRYVRRLCTRYTLLLGLPSCSAIQPTYGEAWRL